MAFVVTLFVCPAVVCDTQLRAKTKPVVPTTDYEGYNGPAYERSVIRTCHPDRKQQPDFVVPG